MRRFVWVALLMGACWTGSAQETQAPLVGADKPPVREPLRMRVKLERTECFGTCPAYTVTLHGDGRVDWLGHSNVEALGRRQGRVTRHELEKLAVMLDRARFFERNEYGELPVKHECVTVGSSTTCTFSANVSICSHSTRAVISVQIGHRSHKIDNDHCSERPELEAIEEFIDRIANTDAWVGRE